MRAVRYGQQAVQKEPKNAYSSDPDTNIDGGSGLLSINATSPCHLSRAIDRKVDGPLLSLPRPQRRSPH